MSGILDLVERGTPRASGIWHTRACVRGSISVSPFAGASECASRWCRRFPLSALQDDEPYPADGRLDVSRFFKLCPRPFLSLDEGTRTPRIDVRSH